MDYTNADLNINVAKNDDEGPKGGMVEVASATYADIIEYF